MSGDIRHREIAFVPIFVGPRPYFALQFMSHSQRTARDDFVKEVRQNWDELKKEGWRIVRVEVQS
jgi:hypothetical protein